MSNEYIQCEICQRYFFTKTGFRLHNENEHIQQSDSKIKGKEETDSKTVLELKDTKGEEIQMNKVIIANCSKETIKKNGEDLQTWEYKNKKQLKENMEEESNGKKTQTNNLMIGNYSIGKNKAETKEVGTNGKETNNEKRNAEEIETEKDKITKQDREKREASNVTIEKNQ